MSGVPVVIAENGFGVPVNPVDSGAPLLTVAANGRGTPIVISERGAPFIVQGLWSPAKLFDVGLSGYWASGFKQRSPISLYQDSAATIPVTDYGQPVGYASRAAGTADALQATALSRPALGRWPKGEKARNLMRASSQPDAGILWGSGASGSGISATRSYVDGAVRYTLSGVSTGSNLLTLSSVATGYIKIDKTRPRYHSTVYARVVSGAEAFGSGGIIAGIVWRSAAGAWVSAELAPQSRSTEWTRLGLGAVTPENENAVHVAAGFGINFPSGVDLNGVVVEFRHPQIEIGPDATPYQPTDADGVPLVGYGQVRNLANGAQAVDNPTYWPASSTQTGITVTKVGTGLEGGVPYADLRFTGTATGNSINAFFVIGPSIQQASVGSEVCGRATARIIGGSLPSPVGTRGFAFTVNELNSSGSWVAGTIGPSRAASSVDVEIESYRTASNASVAGMVGVAQLQLLSGDVIDVTYRIKGLQFESGLNSTPLQHNYGPNNVTEEGVPDVPFLFNDGNDSLPASLPAGAYGVAWVNPAGGVTFTAQTIAAAGQIDVLRGIRTVDVIIRQGDFTQAEKDQITQYWGKYVL